MLSARTTAGTKPSTEGIREIRDERREGEFHVELLHRAVPVVMTPDGIRATAKGKPSNPASVEKYLASKFGSTIKTKTVRAVVEQMSSRFYRQSRRNPATVNRAEITKQIQQLFTRDFGIKLTALTPDALLF